MRQRGRKSADQLAINISAAPSRLATPAGLNARERALFEQLINTTSQRHFRASDIPLLISFVQATLLSRKLGRDSSKVAEWEKATRTMALLATRLRLTPQARVDPKTVGRMRQPHDGEAPWHRRAPHPDDSRHDSDDDEDDNKSLQ